VNFVTRFLPEQDSLTVHWKLHTLFSVAVSFKYYKKYICTFSMTLPNR